MLIRNIVIYYYCSYMKEHPAGHMHQNVRTGRSQRASRYFFFILFLWKSFTLLRAITSKLYIQQCETTTYVNILGFLHGHAQHSCFTPRLTRIVDLWRLGSLNYTLALTFSFRLIMEFVLVLHHQQRSCFVYLSGHMHDWSASDHDSGTTTNTLKATCRVAWLVAHSSRHGGHVRF